MKRLSTLLLLLPLPVWASDRLHEMERAWNSGDTLAIQHGFAGSAVYGQATLAAKSEQYPTLALRHTRKLNDTVWGTVAELGDHSEVWLFQECEQDANVWCWAGMREISGIGGAEAGQAADVAASAVGIVGMGMVEMNPLGIGLLPLKAGALYATYGMAFDDCVEWRAGLDAWGLGAGIGNAVTMLVALTNPIIAFGMTAAFTALRWDGAYQQAVFECAAMALEREAYKNGNTD